MGERLYAVKVALDPTPAQQRALSSHVGAARFVFNRMLAEVKTTLDARAWETRLLGGPVTEPQGWSLPALRRTWNANKHEWAPWWSEVSKEAFNHGLQALSDALHNWADSRHGKRAGAKMAFPRFRSRNRTALSFSYTTGAFRPNNDRVSVQLPRIGRVHTHERLDRLVNAVQAGQARVLRATVSYRQGRWWCSFTVTDTADLTVPDKPYDVVGVDVGVNHLIVAATPDGTEVLRIPPPRTLVELQRKMMSLQRKAARQQRGSARWRTTMRRISRLHGRITNVRNDTIHKATTRLSKMADTVVIENLNVTAMSARKPGQGRKGRGFNRSVRNASFGELHRQLNYKTRWYGSELVRADRWYPSSKTCSACGRREPNLPRGTRTWQCPGCDVWHDRDVNAATNLAHLAVCASCREWRGDAKHGRGATRKPCPAQAVMQVGGCETSTQHRRTSGQTGTASRQREAA